MLYFREKEQARLNRFLDNPNMRSMAIYGRRRTGKTELILKTISSRPFGDVLYFQCPGTDYETCLSDLKNEFAYYYPNDGILQGLNSFKDLFTYISRQSKTVPVIIIDEFPFLAKKREDAVTEFQWIIDHGLGNSKLILLGSNRSFMKHQIQDQEAPLYGRFDEIMEIRPFSFREVNVLFPDFEDAVEVYAQTGGVAQYVMFYKNYSTVEEAVDDLYFDKDGRLFQEAGNMLMQEFRDISTYVAILRALGGSDKNAGQIAQKSGIDSRALFAYLDKLMELEIVEAIGNPLGTKKKDRRYRISDQLFRFSYTFITPNLSMITAIGSAARQYILNEQYNEYLGFVYEDIIRQNCFSYALEGKLAFMPETVGKWWGGVQAEGVWAEGEIDVLAYNDDAVLLGECKYKTKAVGVNELHALQAKAAFVPVNKRKVYYLLASKSGFTEDLQNISSNDVVLIDRA